jgi:hypothetical protein
VGVECLRVWLMKRPRLFLSAVSRELRTARQVVATCVRMLGFDPVSQEDFPTGHGELRQWLRDQIDSCNGLIQLVGHGYGAEPPAVEPPEGRVSYTQLKFLYARRRAKKTWIIEIGDAYPRDHPVEHLDRPSEAAHHPLGYQAERRDLQALYVAGLVRDNHLRHAASNPTELENVVLRLKDELGDLRREAERQQRRLTRTVAAILSILLVLLAGGRWSYGQLHRAVQQTTEVNTDRIRAHLRHTVEETYRHELAAAVRPQDWKERKRLRETADTAHAGRLSRINELAASLPRSRVAARLRPSSRR